MVSQVQGSVACDTSLASMVIQSRDLGEEPEKAAGLAVLEASTWHLYQVAERILWIFLPD